VPWDHSFQPAAALGPPSTGPRLSIGSLAHESTCNSLLSQFTIVSAP
jgi:hypothetical protein